MSFARNFFLGSYQGSPLALPPEPPPPDPDPVAQTRGMITALSGAGSAAYNGRYLVNELVETLPTNNLLTYAYYDRNENGTASPARTLHYATDPLGGNNVTRLQFTALRQQHVWFRASEGNIPNGDYQHRTHILAETVGVSYRIGSSNTAGKYGTIVPTGALAAYDYTVTGFADGYDLGISSDSTTAASYVQVYCQQLYPSGDTIPTLAEEAAGYAGHAKKAFAFEDSITFDANGGIENDATTEGLIVSLPNFPNPTTFTDLTVYMAINPTGYPTGTVGNAVSVDYSQAADLNTTNTKFQMGIGSGGGTGEGTLYTWPVFATNGGIYGGLWYNMVAADGWQVIAMSLSSVAGNAGGQGITTYVNGVPTIISNVAFAGFMARAFRLLSYNGILKARASGSRFIGAADHIWIGNAAHNDVEVREHTRYIEMQLEDEGKTLAAKNLCLITGGDSITAYTVTWAYQGAQDAALIAANTPIFLINEAVGGASLYSANGYLNREARLARRIEGAVARGYDVHLTLLVGANDLVHWRDSTVSYDFLTPCPDSANFNPDGTTAAVPTTPRPWMTDFLAYVARQRARGAKVDIGYMLPRSGFGGAPYSSGSLAAEAGRQAVLAYWDANWEDHFDGRLLFGRHPIMGDYATSAAAYTADTTYYLLSGTHPTYAGHTLLWNDPDPGNAAYCAKPIYEPLV